MGGGATAPARRPRVDHRRRGLDSVPLELEFTGSFFDLADFFHRIKRFVRVANENMVVRAA